LDVEDGLEALIADIHDHLLTTQDFWKGLPEAVCNNMAARQVDTSNCWNGVNKAR
jgi:Glypican